MDPNSHESRADVSLREYVEALFEEKSKALEMAAAERDRAAAVLRDEQLRALTTAETEREKAAAALRAGADRAISDNYARLAEQLTQQKEYFLAVLDEQRRGITVAEQEREKAAQEQRRGQDVAEQEREKAAKALRGDLARAIDEGDRNLREHIAGQVNQIREALSSAEKLDLARHSADHEKINAVQREIEIKATASREAIEKADAANEKRFESVNEFRAQLSDTIATFLPREVADAQFIELRTRVADLTDKLSKLIT